MVVKVEEKDEAEELVGEASYGGDVSEGVDDLVLEGLLLALHLANRALPVGDDLCECVLCRGDAVGEVREGEALGVEDVAGLSDARVGGELWVVVAVHRDGRGGGGGGRGQKVAARKRLVRQPRATQRHMYTHAVLYKTLHVSTLRLFARLDGVPILARNNLYAGRRHHLVGLHLERRVLDDERPHVVAEAVRMQVALSARHQHAATRCLAHYLERRLGLDLLDHRVCKGFVKLDRVSARRRGAGDSTCCRTFMASWGVMAPLVMSSSSESVRAIPMLRGRRHHRQRRTRQTYDEPL